MNFEVAIKENIFESINQYIFEIKNLISASAASVLIIQNGIIVNEWYSGYHENTKHSRKVDVQSQFNIGSIRKTYLGLAISLALFEGRIKSLNDSVSDYLDDLDDDVIADTTIRHLLTHTHGLYSPLKRMFPAGTDWKYNNAGVNLLIRIVQKLFDQPLAKVIDEKVLRPYGLSETGWRKENSENLVWVNESYAGEQGGEANLFVSTRELGFWGYLHLTKGYYQGNQILPKPIIEEAVKIITPATLDETLPRNGFFWWVQDWPRNSSELGGQLPKGSFQSLGIYGNALLVIPKYNVVAVRMLNQTERNPTGYDYLRDIQTFGNMVSECILSQEALN
ncbi:class A beta-lactamase-related serine hydrolase [Paenibacillus albiflavus]|uniref:Class A beta-lactamase-related serine hydrolase n=1 Tax=Paenibacillus albiflavus TaxID=2545760 RepID=A0A4R4E1H8_9BACL|nr:serine hydrolase domain-containing protein [Paenibacillus albiflavus]TCZ69621.1 class A beta-lactamase-related serine hydrolase [Paenibacillus albiflavus]